MALQICVEELESKVTQNSTTSAQNSTTITTNSTKKQFNHHHQQNAVVVDSAVNFVDGLSQEERFRQQQLEASRRENVLVMRLTTKEQEVQDYLVRPGNI